MVGFFAARLLLLKVPAEHTDAVDLKRHHAADDGQDHHVEKRVVRHHTLVGNTLAENGVSDNTGDGHHQHETFLNP